MIGIFSSGAESLCGSSGFGKLLVEPKGHGQPHRIAPGGHHRLGFFLGKGIRRSIGHDSRDSAHCLSHRLVAVAQAKISACLNLVLQFRDFFSASSFLGFDVRKIALKGFAAW